MPSKYNNIKLKHYDDGIPSVLRKKTLYKKLHFYRKSEVLYQLTCVFCERFLPRYGDRTVDQMVQAARSIKQNITEGFTDGETSFETELKLLGIAKGSTQELLEDYQDYIKRHALPEWAEENTARYENMKRFCKEHSDLNCYTPYFSKWNDEEMANVAICLCHMVDKAMTTFMEKRDREFVAEGGVRERMTAARLEMRGTQKQIIDRQQQEIQELRRIIDIQQKEIESLKNKVNTNQQ